MNKDFKNGIIGLLMFMGIILLLGFVGTYGDDNKNSSYSSSKSSYSYTKSIAIVDGDKINECSNCQIGLPGQKAPEKQVIEDLKAINWQNLDGRFGIGAGILFQVLQEAVLEPDHHDWTTYIGNHIKQSKSYVWSVLVEEWCKQCLDTDERERIYNAIVESLNN